MPIDRAPVSTLTWTRGVLWGGGLLGFALLALVVALVSQQSAAAPSMGSKRVYFRIAAGVVSGTDFQMGEVIARVLSRPDGDQPCDPGARCGVTGVTAVATASEGAVANVQLVSTGHVESALTQADIAQWAVQGTGPFARTGAMSDLRVIATLYPEAVHLVAAGGARIKSVADLKGKRVGIDSYMGGGGTDARLILRAFGLGPETVNLVEVGAELAADRLAAGQLDAFFVIGGWPLPLLQDLAQRVPIALVPIRGPAIERVIAENPLLVPISVPGALYGDAPAFETLGVNAVWVTWANQPDPLIYDLTAALWSSGNRSTLNAAHPAGKLIRLADAVWGAPIPLHPGALRYYNERGFGDLSTGALTPIQTVPQNVPMPRMRPAIGGGPEARR